jgi:hypothetical protein
MYGVIYHAERGIYCELNLQSCISYAIPPGSTSKTLKVLRKALLEEGEAEVDAEMLENAVVDRGSLSDVVLGDVTYLHTDAAKKGNSVPLRLITGSDRIAAIGRISAETVRNLRLDHTINLYYHTIDNPNKRDVRNK